MKQNKWFYFILGFASFSGAMVVYACLKGDLATAASNLVCFAINVWCLRVVYSSGTGGDAAEFYNKGYKQALKDLKNWQPPLDDPEQCLHRWHLDEIMLEVDKIDEEGA